MMRSKGPGNGVNLGQSCGRSPESLGREGRASVFLMGLPPPFDGLCASAKVPSEESNGISCDEAPPLGVEEADSLRPVRGASPLEGHVKARWQRESPCGVHNISVLVERRRECRSIPRRSILCPYSSERPHALS